MKNIDKLASAIKLKLKFEIRLHYAFIQLRELGNDLGTYIEMNGVTIAKLAAGVIYSLLPNKK